MRNEDLLDFCISLFSKAGVPRKDAEIVSENLVLANLRGVDSHGAFVRVPHYLRDLQSGVIAPRARVSVIKETDSTGLIDGGNGLGQIAAMKATELAIEKAKTTGVGIVGARNLNHVSMLAHYALKAVDMGLFGLVCATSPPLMPPWGGAKPVLGTNPFCIGFPIGDRKSIVADMATSVVAAGKIAVAAAKKAEIPEGWALDKCGKPTTDPNAFLEGGMLLPFGGYKGFAISLCVEALAGVLIGAPYSAHIRPGWATQGGFLVEIVDIAAFRTFEGYARDVLDLANTIKSCPLAQGFKEVLLPGELESREYEKRSKEGIPVDRKSWNTLRKVSKAMKIPLPAVRN